MGPGEWIHFERLHWGSLQIDSLVLITSCAKVVKNKTLVNIKKMVNMEKRWSDFFSLRIIYYHKCAYRITQMVQCSVMCELLYTIIIWS